MKRTTEVTIRVTWEPDRSAPQQNHPSTWGWEWVIAHEFKMNDRDVKVVGTKDLP